MVWIPLGTCNYDGEIVTKKQLYPKGSASHEYQEENKLWFIILITQLIYIGVSLSLPDDCRAWLQDLDGIHYSLQALFLWFYWFLLKLLTIPYKLCLDLEGQARAVAEEAKRRENINVRAAFIHVIGDFIQVIVVALTLTLTFANINIWYLNEFGIQMFGIQAPLHSDTQWG